MIYIIVLSGIIYIYIFIKMFIYAITGNFLGAIFCALILYNLIKILKL